MRTPHHHDRRQGQQRRNIEGLVVAVDRPVGHGPARLDEPRPPAIAHTVGATIPLPIGRVRDDGGEGAVIRQQPVAERAPVAVYQRGAADPHDLRHAAPPTKP